jgi:hypothetical protein
MLNMARYPSDNVSSITFCGEDTGGREDDTDNEGKQEVTGGTKKLKGWLS